MNDEVRNKLKELVKTYGTELCTDIRKTEGLLRDYCGEHKREIAVLISAMENRIPEEILNAKGDSIDQLQLSRLAKRLHDNEGIAEEYSKWAVKSWAIVLGKKLPENETKKLQTETSESYADSANEKEDQSRKTEVTSGKNSKKGMIGEMVWVGFACWFLALCIGWAIIIIPALIVGHQVINDRDVGYIALPIFLMFYFICFLRKRWLTKSWRSSD